MPVKGGVGHVGLDPVQQIMVKAVPVVIVVVVIGALIEVVALIRDHGIKGQNRAKNQYKKDSGQQKLLHPVGKAAPNTAGPLRPSVLIIGVAAVGCPPRLLRFGSAACGKLSLLLLHLGLHLQVQLMHSIGFIRALVADGPAAVRLVFVYNKVAVPVLIDAESLWLFVIDPDEKAHLLQGQIVFGTKVLQLLYGLGHACGIALMVRIDRAAIGAIFLSAFHIAAAILAF